MSNLPSSQPPVEPSAERPPIATKAPPTDRKFPCKQCGAKLNFDPAARSLACPYCGFVEKIDPGTAEIEEHDFQEYLSRQAGETAVIEGRSNEVRCQGCGAMVLLEDKVATDRCPFCGTHLENAPVAAEAMI